MKRLLAVVAGAVLAVGGTGCGGVDASDEDVVGEAAAALSVDEESGDVAPEAVVDAEVDVDATADEDVASTDGDAPSFDVCDFQARRQAVLAKYDADGNGKIDKTEAQAIKTDLGQGRHPLLNAAINRVRHRAFLRVRWAFDEDGDKVLDETERANLVAAMEARCDRLRQQVLDKFDADQDGKLSAAERTAAREAAQARFQAKRAQVLAKYDANSNGKLELTERAQLRTDLRAAWMARKQAAVAKYDTDQDGKLSQAEALVLKQDIQKRIAEGADAE